MVHANFVQNLDNELVGLTLTGHADYNPGNDIVCAGISAICFSVLGSLKNLRSVKMDYRADAPGDMEFRIIDVGLIDILRVEGIMLTLQVGLLQIQEAHPEHLEITGL